MNLSRFQEISARYAGLRIAIVGDFCLDRYLEIDPARQEISIETGLPVHNVVNVRSQPGAAGDEDPGGSTMSGTTRATASAKM